MKRSKPISGRYLGYREADRATPYARFFNPELAPLASHVCAALDRGGVPIDLLPGIDGAAENLFGDTAVLEDGWVLTQDGGMRVSVRTDMPGVTPAMVDWWFGWHGDARALLVHCGQEMPHLAAFLPALHAEFADNGPAGTSNTRTAS